MIDAYLREIIGNEQTARLRRHQKLKDLFQSYEDNLKAKRKVVREFADSLGTKDIHNANVKQRILPWSTWQSFEGSWRSCASDLRGWKSS